MKKNKKLKNWEKDLAVELISEARENCANQKPIKFKKLLKLIIGNNK